jgi:imidazolonepropionase-like amidohydrolase
MSRAGGRLLAAGALLAALSAPLVAQDLVVRGGTVHTVAGESIADGVVVIEDGRIVAVGSAAVTSIPAGVQVIEAEVVTPGLIDAHTVVGMAGYLNQPHDQDQLERSAPIQPELRAIDGYNGREALVEWVRGFGVTTIHTGHGPGTLISGETLIAKTSGTTVEEAVIVPRAAIAGTLGEGAVSKEKDPHPGTRSKAVAMLRGQLVEAESYRRKRSGDGDEHPDRDLRLEALAEVLDGEVPLMITVHRYHDILAALRVAEEFGILLILDGAAEAYLVIDRIRAAGVPVILHPTMQRAWGERENLSFETAAKLDREAIPFALQSGYESYVPKTRVVLFEAAAAAAYGLPFDRALASITLEAARILGIDDRVGSLEPGKDADLALYDGDPFEYTSHCVGVVIDGVLVEDGVR